MMHQGCPGINLGHFFVFFFSPVDLISIDRRNRDLEAECLERASVLAQRFLDSVQDTADYVWKPADRSPPELDWCVFYYHSWTLNKGTEQKLRGAFKPLRRHISLS